MFQGALLVRPDTREEYGESRWIGIGMIRHRIAVVAFAEGAEETVRIISVRKATHNERSNTRKHSRTNWKRVDRLKDEEIDYSEVPQLGPDFFTGAVRWPGKKKQITLRLDPDVLAFFRKHGKGYQTTINAVLRKYVEGRKRSAS